MQCPNCLAIIKFRERRSNQCLKCNGTFVFEPKAHPLGLTDRYFSKTAFGLSDNGKFYFTAQQFQFALSQKKNRQSTASGLLIFPAFLTTVPAFCYSAITGFFVLFFWLFVIFYKNNFTVKTVKLYQTLSDFDAIVLQPWKKAHGKLPSHLIAPTTLLEEFKNEPRGFLICDSEDTAVFLNANKLNEKFGLFITTDFHNPQIKNRNDLPVFVLHDASRTGYEFVEQIKRIYENEQNILDIGLRPNDVRVFELPVFRAKHSNRINAYELSVEEIKWLDKGFYTPLFVLKPSRLIEIVSRKIEREIAATETL